MIISLINFSIHKQDDEIQEVLRVLNRQIAEDFQPYWHRSGQLRLEGGVGHAPSPERPREMRGDAVIYLQDEAGEVDALGYHDRNLRGIPYGFVFLDLCKELEEDWRVTLSHEALELIMDPEANLLVRGPHPEDASRSVYHWYEVCDAVQAQSYEIDGIPVSNFVLPLYFTETEEKGSRNDFLGAREGQANVVSFGVAPGGYIGYYDSETGDHETYTAPEDAEAQRRMEVKYRAGWARRGLRHEGGPTSETVRRLVTGCAAGEPLPGPWFEGFDIDVEVRDGEIPLDYLARAAVTVLGPNWASSWTVYESTLCENEGLHFEYELVPQRDNHICCEDAWQWSYEFREQAGISEVEPSFVYLTSDLDALDERGSPRRASGLWRRNLPESDDPRWCAQAIQLDAAWSLSTGAGVRIAHPDTGWQRHPEVDHHRNGGRVRPDLGYDFVDDDDDPGAERGDDNLLPGGPNHGTATAGVIVSAPGKQSQAYEEFVVGVAPDAELIPLRVGNSVVHFSMSRVRRAIDYAVAHEFHVISMSLGGPFSNRRLRAAIRRAKEQGVILIAASGNYIPFRAVVYPARYSEVIAVAASNAADRPWSGSSRGSKVDITAPGESVWRALVVETDKGLIPAVERSSGTSYSTAHITGVCALWIAHHGRELLFQKYGSGMTNAFRLILRETAQSGVEMDPDDFGHGIVDAEAVLRHPLPDLGQPVRGRRVAPPDVEDELEQFRALLPHLGDAELRHALRGLLGVTARNLQARLRRFGPELAFQLGSDQRLLRDFDSECRALSRSRGRRRSAAPRNRDIANVRRRLRSISTSRALREALS
jgi:hypothetical protein